MKLFLISSLFVFVLLAAGCNDTITNNPQPEQNSVVKENSGIRVNSNIIKGGSNQISSLSLAETSGVTVNIRIDGFKTPIKHLDGSNEIEADVSWHFLQSSNDDYAYINYIRLTYWFTDDQGDSHTIGGGSLDADISTPFSSGDYNWHAVPFDIANIPSNARYVNVYAYIYGYDQRFGNKPLSITGTDATHHASLTPGAVSVTITGPDIISLYSSLTANATYSCSVSGGVSGLQYYWNITCLNTPGQIMAIPYYDQTSSRITFSGLGKGLYQIQCNASDGQSTSSSNSLTLVVAQPIPDPF